MAEKKLKTNIPDNKVRDIPLPHDEVEELRANLVKAQKELKLHRQQLPDISPKSKPPEEAYRALIQLAHDMGQAVVMLRDIDGREGVHVFASDIWTDITGYSKEELLGMSFFDLVLPEYKKASMSRHRQKMSGTPAPGKFTLAIRKKDGCEAVIEISSAVSDSEGLPTNIVFIRDVTNIIEAEAKAKEYEQQFQTIIKLANDTGEAIVILQNVDGVEGKYVFVNELWPKITGYSEEELLNMSAFDLISPEHVEASRNRYRDILIGKVMPELFEGGILTKQGNKVPVELSIAPITYLGKNSALVHLRDITKRKQTEMELRNEKERFQVLFDNAPIVICEADFSQAKKLFDKLRTQGIADFDAYFESNPDMVFKSYFNKSVILSNPETLVQKEVASISDGGNITTVDNRKYRLFHKNACQNKSGYWRCIKDNLVDLAEGKTTIAGEKLSVTVTGKTKILWQHLVVAHGYEDTLSKVFLYYIDLTEIKEKERKLKEYQEHLEDLVRERTNKLEESTIREHQLYESESALRRELEQKIKQQKEFIHRLVHELKSPLFPMLSASEMMLNHAKDNDLKQIALNINRGAKVLTNSVNDLIDVMRGEIGILQLDFSEFDIKDIVTEVADFMKFEAERHRQIIILHLQEQIPILIGDYKRLRQVIMNLLENALRYSPSGGKINLQINMIGSEISVRVIDDGPGIITENLQSVFEPYHSTENRFRQTGGLGLGLPLAKMIIELHGGTIWARNLEGCGAEVGFSIPMRLNGTQ